MKVRLTFALLCLLSLSLFAQPADIAPLQAERVANNADGRTVVIIRANVRKAAVFLNGNFEGTTMLTLYDLMRGQYHLRVTQHAYEPKDYMITVQPECTQEFYVELQKLPSADEATE